MSIVRSSSSLEISGPPCSGLWTINATTNKGPLAQEHVLFVMTCTSSIFCFLEKRKCCLHAKEGNVFEEGFPYWWWWEEGGWVG